MRDVGDSAQRAKTVSNTTVKRFQKQAIAIERASSNADFRKVETGTEAIKMTLGKFCVRLVAGRGMVK